MITLEQLLAISINKPHIDRYEDMIYLEWKNVLVDYYPNNTIGYAIHNGVSWQPGAIDDPETIPEDLINAIKKEENNVKI